MSRFSGYKMSIDEGGRQQGAGCHPLTLAATERRLIDRADFGDGFKTANLRAD